MPLNVIVKDIMFLESEKKFIWVKKENRYDNTFFYDMRYKDITFRVHFNQCWKIMTLGSKGNLHFWTVEFYSSESAQLYIESYCESL